MISLAEARAWLVRHTNRRAPERIPLHQAAHRTLAADIALAMHPTHPIATIDGLAVCAAHTEGAGEYAPVPIDAWPVVAGAPLPPGCDAVLPPFAAEHGTALTPVAPGTNVHPPGHDIPPDATLLAGTRLAPLHLAPLHLAPLHLALLGHDPLVYPVCRVEAPGSPVLHALIAAQGSVVVADDPDLLLLDQARFTHLESPGIALRPGETTAIGLVGTAPAILLPPRPADAATVFALLVAPVLRHLQRQPEPLPTQARLTRKITSGLGQIDAIRVRVDGDHATPLGPAEGIGLLAAIAADGLVLVPEGSEGYPAGTMVPIYPL